MKRNKIIAALLLSNFVLVSAQNINFFPQSPNSTPFAVNGKIPVNMYKGTPLVNIPLFSKSINGKPFDLSLNYNVKSVKPETVPTWVGLGWNLEVGGSISRIVNGGIDEVYQANLQPYNRFSYLDNYSTLDTPSWSSLQTMETYSLNNLQYMVKDITKLGAVPDPDEFIINFCGITGSFYMSEKGTWIGRTRDGRTFKVVHNYKNDFKVNEKAILGGSYIAPKTTTVKRILYGFTIVLDDGTQAVFGNDDNAVEFTSTDENIDPFNPQMMVSNWYLKEIKFPDNKKMSFSYLRDERAVFLNNKSGQLFYNKKDQQPWTYNSTSGGNLNQIQTNRLHTTYLDKIEGDDFIINFNKSLANQKEYNPLDYAISTWNGFYTHHMSAYGNYKHWHKLDNITVKDKAGNVIKNILFNYNNVPDDRLLLTDVTINGTEKYKLTYNPQKLPDYLSTSTDEWGYYNGNTILTSNNTNNMSSEQLKNYLVNNYPQAKAPNLSLSKASTLEQITYPTGGSTYFTYELNSYSQYGEKEMPLTALKLNPVANDVVSGGLRIQKIKSCNENNNCIQKMYSYLDDNGRSSGILPYKPVYLLEGSEPSAGLVFWEWSSHSYQNLKDEDNTVGYSKVTEIDDNGGKKETYFTNFSNPDFNDTAGVAYFGWSHPGIFRGLPYTSFSLMRGKPSKEITYSSTNKISETHYTYSKHTDYIKAYTSSYRQFGQTFSHPPFVLYDGITYGALLDAHYVNFNSSFLTQKKTVFENIESTETNTYNYTYNSLKTSKKQDGDGNLWETNYTYSTDVNNPGLQNAYMVNVPIATEVKKNNKIISKAETRYGTTNLLPVSELSFDLQSILPTTEITYDQYDVTNGNLQQFTTKDGISTVVIWGYNNTQPIAKIENAKLSDISQSAITAIVNASDVDAGAVPNSDESTFLNALKIFRDSLSAYRITTYTYDPLVGVRSITSPAGIKESYTYDGLGRLEKVIDTNGKILKEMKYNYKN